MYVIYRCIYIDILIYKLLKVVEEKAQEEQQEEEQQQEEQVAGGVPAQSHENVTNTETVNGRGRGRGTGRGTGSEREMAQERNVNEGLSRGRGMTQHSQTSSEANYSIGGLGRRKRPVEHEDTSGGQTRPFKRPRMVGVGIYQAKDGFTTLNPGLPSRRVINTGTKVTKRADVVTGDIGYTPVLDSNGRGRQLLPVAT
ncbi:uncharacterized protein [Solanum lycopersicum]|uniref:uncharacterized protein n=1 Tax=Solanum lycopersicum TaxID=4081 RepID=UPI000E1CA365|nr:uncharacterized protein LOC104646965 [Solanum lycopersicum]